MAAGSPLLADDPVDDVTGPVGDLRLLKGRATPARAAMVRWLEAKDLPTLPSNVQHQGALARCLPPRRRLAARGQAAAGACLRACAHLTVVNHGGERFRGHSSRRTAKSTSRCAMRWAARHADDPQPAAEIRAGIGDSPAAGRGMLGGGHASGVPGALLPVTRPAADADHRLRPGGGMVLAACHRRGCAVPGRMEACHGRCDDSPDRPA